METIEIKNEAFGEKFIKAIKDKADFIKKEQKKNKNRGSLTIESVSVKLSAGGSK